MIDRAEHCPDFVLQSQSGCRIQIAKQCAPGTFVRDITLEGSAEAIEYAKQLIEQKAGPLQM